MCSTTYSGQRSSTLADYTATSLPPKLLSRSDTVVDRVHRIPMHTEQVRRIPAGNRRRRSDSHIDQRRAQAIGNCQRKEAVASNKSNLPWFSASLTSSLLSRLFPSQVSSVCNTSLRTQKMAFTDDALFRAELPNFVHAIATLIKCIAFYITMRALKVLVVDILRVDLSPAAEALIGELRSSTRPPTFRAQGANWSGEEAGQEKREV
ncbi:hypothetical protein E4T39_03928 [Aureobasidium subglaciale]|nr:hypothetical protein E4T39_03928 [Aureobasidium subglaciale]